MDSIHSRKNIAIIGAGISGLAIAWSLRSIPSVKIHIIEKSRGFSGRTTTRRIDDFNFDHGANYFFASSVETQKLIQEDLYDPELINIDKRLDFVDKEGNIVAGSKDNSFKWNYSSGISKLGKIIFDKCNKTTTSVNFTTRVGRLEEVFSENKRQWKLISTEEKEIGTYDLVILTPPGPQTLELVKTAVITDKRALTVRDQLNKFLVPSAYKSVLAVALAFNTVIQGRREYYALLNIERDGPVLWLSFEDDKKGHVPTGKSLIIVQFSPTWSKKNYDIKEQDLVQMARTQAALLLKDDMITNDKYFLWGNIQRWRYALPENSVPETINDIGAEIGLQFAGDYLLGQGRVGGTLEQGIKYGEKLIPRLVKSALQTTRTERDTAVKRYCSRRNFSKDNMILNPSAKFFLGTVRI